MLLERTNLVNALLRERLKATTEEELLAAVRTLLAQDGEARAAIQQRINHGTDSGYNHFDIDLLETNRIFHINQLKSICIDYRLRFLDSHLLKSHVPEEAISRIKKLETEHNTVLKGFKIMAPSKQFYLENYDDPLLFAPIGNDYYYLIHKWGNDLSPYRKLLVRPFRNAGSLLLLLATISMLFALLIADNPFNKVEKDLFVLLAFLFIFKSLCGVALYYCFWRGKNFNIAIWNNEYYNK